MRLNRSSDPIQGSSIACTSILLSDGHFETPVPLRDPKEQSWEMCQQRWVGCEGAEGLCEPGPPLRSSSGARAAEVPSADGTEHHFHPLQQRACGSHQARMVRGLHSSGCPTLSISLSMHIQCSASDSRHKGRWQFVSQNQKVLNDINIRHRKLD